MRRVILYIAMSLDGDIADSNDGVDWLDSGNGLDGEGWMRSLFSVNRYRGDGLQYLSAGDRGVLPRNMGLCGKDDRCIDASSASQSCGYSVCLSAGRTVSQDFEAAGWTGYLDLWGSKCGGSAFTAGLHQCISDYHSPHSSGTGNSAL